MYLIQPRTKKPKIVLILQSSCCILFFTVPYFLTTAAAYSCNYTCNFRWSTNSRDQVGYQWLCRMSIHEALPSHFGIIAFGHHRFTQSGPLDTGINSTEASRGGCEAMLPCTRGKLDEGHICTHQTLSSSMRWSPCFNSGNLHWQSCSTGFRKPSVTDNFKRLWEKTSLTVLFRSFRSPELDSAGALAWSGPSGLPGPWLLFCCCKTWPLEILHRWEPPAERAKDNTVEKVWLW